MMRIVCILFIVLSLSIACAQLGDAFSSEPAALTPPSPEAAGGTQLTLMESDTNRQISDAHVEILLERDKEKINTIVYVPSNKSLQLPVDEGMWSITLRADYINTAGKDYYGFASVDAAENQAIAMMPVGSIRGRVVDEAGNYVGNSEVKIECSGAYGDMTGVATDKYGEFSALWLPVGNCKLSALHSGKVGSTEVNVQKAKLESIIITLGTSVVGGTGLLDWLILAAISVVALSFIVSKKLSSAGAVPANAKAPAVAPSQLKRKPVKWPTEKMQSVMKALDENERRVVDAVIGDKGKTTQAAIFRKTLIPKTSLLRAIQRLEARNIIETVKDGKLRHVKFTKWFLE